MGQRLAGLPIFRPDYRQSTPPIRPLRWSPRLAGVNCPWRLYRERQPDSRRPEWHPRAWLRRRRSGTGSHRQCSSS